MLNLNLDDEAEKYLVEILAQEKTTSSELIKRLLHEHWQSLQPRKTVLERMGGYPEHLLQGPSDLSDRDARYKYLAEYFQKRYEQSQQKQEA
ncbi:hypothetical protein OGM63_26330 [Plectonema radiosum NIES-515]|uniref:Ribbon-helix-helix protein CopG domain-containing protein n=1 Tax=Plectonema radiosum NIES-515 TaxID=2986073 RepID=A0ABT3B6H8_9CYAN|nr:hypothetical protein [Plectonema radiosum]MCV3216981.1 hypothetical protein [Plectonema radiosum NIES-515]